ncbi:MAG: hypothetical protein GY765_15925, partial [bacterium]|nr:hypothetical protein [bacterium]
SVGSFLEGYALDAGFADYFACAATNDGMLGEGSGSGRNLDNNHMYPGKAAYNIEGHTGGMIIAGAAWDLRGMFIEQMGETTGSRFADRLIFDAHQVMSNLPREYFFSDPGESNFLTSLYTADDDNSNLADGVPHFNEIHRAFANHDLLQAVLHSGNSYDVSANQLGFYSGGDFYVAGSGKFYANNLGQRGIRSLGNIGNGPLEDVDIPTAGYTRFGVPIAVGHTYVSKAQQGEEGSFIVFRVSAYDAGSGDVTIRYFYHSGSLRLNNKDSYDFSAKIRKRITGGDFYLSGLKFWANNVDQGAVQDLGNLGRTALERVDIPSDNYSRQGVPVVRDHTYVARAGGGERAFIVFRVLGISGDSISIQYIYKKGNLITLYDRDSYDFKLKSRGSLSGGDFYFSGGKFFANNQGQKGLISLGNQGRTLLADVSIPKTGYTRFGVTPVVGHTYVALARRSGNYVVFKVTAFNNNSVTVDYLYLDMALSLVDGDSYDFSLKKKGKYSGGDFYFSGGKFLANNVGQRGVIDLGNLGRTTLKNVTIPSRGYTRFGVVAITGNTYVVQAGQDEEGNFIVLKVLEVDNEKISIEYLYVEVAVTLENGQSYDFSKRKKARYSGGDVYYSSGKFYCNNTGQRGALDLGNQGRTALKNVIIPSSGYNRFGVDAVAGHTYAVLAQQGEEGYVIVFKILSFSGDTVTLEYLYKAVM